MLDKVVVVSSIVCCERDAISKAARSDPRVVYWSRAASEGGVSRDRAPGTCNVVITVQNVLVGQPPVKKLATAWSPLTLFHPPVQFAEGDKGNHGRPPSQESGHVGGQLALDDQGGDVGV